MVSRSPARSTSRCLVSIYGMDEKWTPKPLALSAALCTYCVHREKKHVCKTALSVAGPEEESALVECLLSSRHFIPSAAQSPPNNVIIQKRRWRLREVK